MEGVRPKLNSTQRTFFSPGLSDSIGIWLNGLEADFRKEFTTENNQGLFMIHLNKNLLICIWFSSLGTCLELRNKTLQLNDCNHLNWFICQNAQKIKGK